LLVEVTVFSIVKRNTLKTFVPNYVQEFGLWIRKNRHFLGLPDKIYD
jgi:hypothetical protein